MSRTGHRTYRANRAKVLELDSQRVAVCWLCGQPIDKTLTLIATRQGTTRPHPMSGTAHHVQPYDLGGSDELSNLVPAHWQCNIKQSDSLTPRVNKQSRQWY